MISPTYEWDISSVQIAIPRQKFTDAIGEAEKRYLFQGPSFSGTLLKINMSPTKGQFQKERVVFQPSSFLRGDASFLGSFRSSNFLLCVNFSFPIGSMYGIFTYIYHKHQPNLGKNTIHGSYRFMEQLALSSIPFFN